MRRICMVPSNTLSSTDAAKLALKVLERPIVVDYLAETNFLTGTFAALLVPNEQDWWDTLSKASYAGILSKRHPKLNYDKLMADKLRWPDLSTFNGPFVLSFAYGGAVLAPSLGAPKRGKGRSEIYEIKPNNERGFEDAKEKLDDVEASYKRHGIAGIYWRGMIYPARAVGRKTIPLESRFVEIYEYLVNLFLKRLGVRVRGISIELKRPESGVLLYKICVDLEGLDAAPKETAWMVANFAVRILSVVNTVAEGGKVSAEANAIVDAMEPVEVLRKSPSELQWVIAGNDLRTIPYLRLKACVIAEEVAPRLNGIRDAMYSRLIGEPGERYFLCADEQWYQLNIELPNVMRMAAQVRMLGTQDAVRSAASRSLSGLTVAASFTASELLRAAPRLALVLGAEIIHWMIEHPKTTIVIIAATVVVTALLIASAGAAAPALVPAGEAAAAVASGGGGAMAAPIMAAAAPEAAAISALPVAAAGESGAVPPLLALARQLAATPLTASELATAAAERAADDILIKALTHPAAQAAIRAGVKASVPAALAIVGLSPGRAYASTGPAGGQVSAGSVQDGDSVALGTGRLMVLKVPRFLPYPTPSAPSLYEVFKADLFAAPPPLSQPPAPPIGKLRMLGSFEVL